MAPKSAKPFPQSVQLNVWYLEDVHKNFNEIKQSGSHISKKIQTQWNDDYRAAVSVKAPKCKVNFLWFKSVAAIEEKVKSLKDLRNCSTKPRPAFPSLLVLDYFLKEDGSLHVENATTSTGEAFLDWLKKELPSVPRCFLTHRNDDTGLDPQFSKTEPPATLGKEFGAILLERHPNFWSALQRYSQDSVKSWHTPGHNKGAAFENSVVLRPIFEAYTNDNSNSMVFGTDLSVSVNELGDLSEPGDRKNLMAMSMAKAAAVFGAHQTLFCTNGTSTSNRVILMTLLRPGETVLVDRNCHKSVHQAIVMSGALPYYITPQFNRQLGLWMPLSFEEIQAAITHATARGLSPKLLILTTCTYEGVLYPIKELSKLAHDHGILFYADEAWFAYGRFHPYYASGPSAGRYNALDSDADFAVHSTHKVLAAFSQSSMVHIGRHFYNLLDGTVTSAGLKFEWLRSRFESYDIFRHQLEEMLRFWLSTSPHYPMIATLDAATAQMGVEGPALLDRLLQEADKLHGWAEENGCNITKRDLVGSRDGFQLYGFDPLKFSVEIKPNRWDDFHEYIKNKHQWEKATERTALFLLTAGTLAPQALALRQALDNDTCRPLLGKENADRMPDPGIQGQPVVLPRDAHYAKGVYYSLTQVDELENAIACHMVTPFPPGIPTILPGLRISRSALEWIRDLYNKKYQVHGLLISEGRARIRVLSDEEYEQLQESYREVHIGEALNKLQTAQP